MRNKLSREKCEKARNPGRYNDGGGLYLYVRPDGGKSWVFRWRDRVTKKLREKGLGPYGDRDVTLKTARDQAGDCRRIVRAGGDPIEVAKQERREAKLARAKALTFKDCSDRFIAAHRASWTNEKHAAQWGSTLETYAAKLMTLPVAEIDTGLVMQCLEPIWSEKTETATRVRQRIEAVLDWATARQYRTGENPARWKGHLDKLLPKPTRLKKVKHRAALPYQEIGTFMDELRKQNGQAARALELQILTALRPGEVVAAKWEEFDLNAKTWTVPAERMKAKKELVVPLSPQALAVIKSMPQVNDYVFPGATLKKSMTTAAGMKLLKELRTDVTQHGFRSTFRDWAGETTAYAREVIEMAMAHQLKDKSEAAYARGNLLEKRRRLMTDWAKFCDQKPPATTVTPIRSAKA